MKKATSEEFLELLKDFKLKNNIEDSRFDYYAIFKFYKSTLLNEFYDITLAKTDFERAPIMINYSKDNMLQLDPATGVLGTAETSPNYVPVLKDKHVPNLTLFSEILESSNSFKEIVTRSIDVLGKNLEDSDLSKGVDMIKVINHMVSLNNAIHRDGVNENSLGFYIDHIIEDIPYNNLRKYTLMSHFRERSNDDPVELMDKFYKDFDKHFDAFKTEQSLVVGRLLHVPTENQTLDKPLLNQFITELQEKHPEWFVSFNQSLHHAFTDDNQIRAAGRSLSDSTADFDLIDPKTFMATASPSSYTDGYDHISRRFMSSDSNDVHIYGDNPFFKVYYHNLNIVASDGLTFCKDIESDVAFCIRDSSNKEYIYPVLDYLEKNNIILDLTHSSRFFHYIKKDDLTNLVEAEYPNLILLQEDLNHKKRASILESNNFDKAFDIYKNNNQDIVQKLDNPKFKAFKLNGH